MADIEREPVRQKKSLSYAETVLIKSDDSDDALCYQAPIAKKIKAESFMVYCHTGSRLFERVRLFGSMKVIGKLLGQEDFVGELFYHHQEMKENDLGEIGVLELKILSFFEPSLSHEHPLIPLT